MKRGSFLFLVVLFALLLFYTGQPLATGQTNDDPYTVIVPGGGGGILSPSSTVRNICTNGRDDESFTAQVYSSITGNPTTAVYSNTPNQIDCADRACRDYFSSFNMACPSSRTTPETPQSPQYQRGELCCQSGDVYLCNEDEWVGSIGRVKDCGSLGCTKPGPGVNAHCNSASVPSTQQPSAGSSSSSSAGTSRGFGCTRKQDTQNNPSSDQTNNPPESEDECSDYEPPEEAFKLESNPTIPAAYFYEDLPQNWEFRFSNNQPQVFAPKFNNGQSQLSQHTPLKQEASTETCNYYIFPYKRNEFSKSFNSQFTNFEQITQTQKLCKFSINNEIKNTIAFHLSGSELQPPLTELLNLPEELTAYEGTSSNDEETTQSALTFEEIKSFGDCTPGFEQKAEFTDSQGNTFKHCIKTETFQAGNIYITDSYIQANPGTNEICQRGEGYTKEGQEFTGQDGNSYYLCVLKQQIQSQSDSIYETSISTEECPSGFQSSGDAISLSSNSQIKHCIKKTLPSSYEEVPTPIQQESSNFISFCPEFLGKDITELDLCYEGGTYPCEVSIPEGPEEIYGFGVKKLDCGYAIIIEDNEGGPITGGSIETRAQDFVADCSSSINEETQQEQHPEIDFVYYYKNSESDFVCDVTLDSNVIIPEEYNLAVSLRFYDVEGEPRVSTYPSSESCQSLESGQTVCTYTKSQEEYQQDMSGLEGEIVETECSVILQKGYNQIDQQSVKILINEEEICEDFTTPALNEAEALHLNVLENLSPDSTLEELNSFVSDLSLAAGRYIGAREEIGDLAYLERTQTFMTLYKVQQEIERKGGITNPEISLVEAENEYYELATRTTNSKIKSLAYTQLAIIALNKRNDLESAYLSASQAVEADPTNEGAKELHKALRIGMLEGINKRLSENANKVLDYSLFKDERVMSESMGSITYAYVSLKEGFLNPVNALREVSVPSIDKQAIWYPILIDTKFGVASMMNFERKGGDVSKFYDLIDNPSEQIEYLKETYPDKSSSELSEVRDAMNLAIRNPDVNFVARNGDIHGLTQTTNDEGIEVLIDKFGYEVRTELIYAHGGGYFNDYTFEKTWYDDVLSEVNGLNALIYLGPSGACSSLSRTAIGRNALARVSMMFSTKAQVGITATSIIGSGTISYVGGPPWLSNFVDITGDLLTPGKGELVDGVAHKVGKDLAREFSEEFGDQMAIKLASKGVDDAYEVAAKLTDDLAVGRIATKHEIADSVRLTLDEIDDVAIKAWNNAQIEKYPSIWGLKKDETLAGGYTLDEHVAGRCKPDGMNIPVSDIRHADGYHSNPELSHPLIINGIPHIKGRGIPAPVVEDALLNPAVPPFVNERGAMIYVSRTELISKSGSAKPIYVLVNPETKKIITVLLNDPSSFSQF